MAGMTARKERIAPLMVRPPIRLTALPRTGSEMLHDAAEVIEQRGKVYGSPKKDFERTAMMWSAIIGAPVQPQHVAMCMMALKISRLCETPNHADSWLDIAGYAACGSEVV